MPEYDGINDYDEHLHRNLSPMEAAGEALFERVAGGLLAMLFLPYPGAVLLLAYFMLGGMHAITPWLFVPAFLYGVGLAGWTRSSWEPYVLKCILQRTPFRQAPPGAGPKPLGLLGAVQGSSMFSSLRLWLFGAVFVFLATLVGGVSLWFSSNAKTLRSNAETIKTQSLKLKSQTAALQAAELNLIATKETYEKAKAVAANDLRIARDNAASQQNRAERFGGLRMEIARAPATEDAVMAPVLVRALNSVRDELRGTLDPVPDAG